MLFSVKCIVQRQFKLGREYCNKGRYLICFFFFSSRRRHTRSCLVSWARRCVQETGINAEYMGSQNQTQDQIEFLPSQLLQYTQDHQSSYIILQESYDNIKNLVRSEEAKDDRIKYEHENLRVVLQKVPKLNEESLNEQRIQEQQSLCEKGWGSLRLLLQYINPKIRF
eukprot:TRINITY_DN2154_c0_g1_i1.p2 TRINITY_DN2154_c0_g1~~TRINITY_DN2154_c0_g1_i1.p2  ORF type:complete len:168 (+),score=28.63 TRINITY_DN2154_c0_g1_i1:2-505(+)